MTVRFLLILALATSSYAEPKLVIEGPDMPQPPAAQRARWMTNFFESDEIWRFKNQEGYEAFLNEIPNLDAALREELKVLYVDRISDAVYFSAQSHYNLSTPGGFVAIPDAIRARMSHDLIERFLSRQMASMKVLPLGLVAFPDNETAETIFAARGYSETEKRALRESLYTVGERRLLIHDRLHWASYPESVREAAVAATVESATYNHSLKPKLVIHQGDDLAELARKYAGQGDSRAIERLFRRALGKAESVEIPLEKILHPFIRKRVGTFAECHGPNCLNVAENMNRRTGGSLGHTDDQALMHELLVTRRFVEPDEKLKSGDLLVYRNLKGELTHVSAYLGDDLVFTKNGMAEYSPYVIQNITHNENLYFPVRDFRLMVLRKPEAGRAPAGADVAEEIYHTDLLARLGCLRRTRKTMN